MAGWLGTFFIASFFLLQIMTPGRLVPGIYSEEMRQVPYSGVSHTERPDLKSAPALSEWSALRDLRRM